MTEEKWETLKLGVKRRLDLFKDLKSNDRYIQSTIAELEYVLIMMDNLEKAGLK